MDDFVTVIRMAERVMDTEINFLGTGLTFGKLFFFSICASVLLYAFFKVMD